MPTAFGGATATRFMVDYARSRTCRGLAVRIANLHLATIVLAQALFDCALGEAAAAAIQEIAFAKRCIGADGALAVRAGAFHSA